MSAWPQTESELAAPLIAMLEARAFTVYPEVRIGGIGGIRADLVAVNDDVLGVHEVKRAIGRTIVEQARRWLPVANYVSVCVPHAQVLTPERRQFYRDLELLGIGCDTVARSPYDEHRGTVDEFAVVTRVEPRINPNALTAGFRRELRDEHKTFGKAGTNGGDYYTPFKAQVCGPVREYVGLHPKCRATDLLRDLPALRKRYKSPKRLVDLTYDGHIDGVALVPNTSPAQFVLTEQLASQGVA